MWINRSRLTRSARALPGRTGTLARRSPHGRKGLCADRSAVTALEYALMGAFVMGAIIAAVSGYGGGLGALMVSSFAAVTASM